MDAYINGCVTSGSYFTYNGVRYGQYTKILFTEEFYKRVGEYINPAKTMNKDIWAGRKKPYFRTLVSIEMEDGKQIWNFGKHGLIGHRYINIDPEQDIEKIVVPVYYLEPKELVKKRIKNGTWINYILPQTLFYAFCLLISPIFKEWYLIWTIGTYIYLRTSYITLSKGELNRGWQN